MKSFRKWNPLPWMIEAHVSFKLHSRRHTQSSLPCETRHIVAFSSALDELDFSVTWRVLWLYTKLISCFSPSLLTYSITDRSYLPNLASLATGLHHTGSPVFSRTPVSHSLSAPGLVTVLQAETPESIWKEGDSRKHMKRGNWKILWSSGDILGLRLMPVSQFCVRSWYQW